MKIDSKLTAQSLRPAVQRLFQLAARKVRALDRAWDPAKGSPVFTVEGKYTSRGWTEWTQGFQFGSALLVYDATEEKPFFMMGRRRTIKHMLPHVTHVGVHDHGFNNLSTYGNLLRLLKEKRSPEPYDGWEEVTYRNAIACSGAVQAARWSGTPGRPDSPHAAHSTGLGYIYSFNGPHSLFVDTMRTTRILGAAWKLGHVLMHENDRKADLLKRSVLHGLTTSQYILFHGDSDHTYDIAGRTAHEAIFNRNDGAFRCRSSQQGYSPFSTWTRGLAWAMLGYAEELEFFATIDNAAFKASAGLAKKDVLKVYEAAARATCDHYINDVTALDGIPYWDDGAPGLAQLDDWREFAADPFNDHEPVDSSAASIAAQGLIRLGNYLGKKNGQCYLQAGLSVARALFDEPYLVDDKGTHQGLILHSIYHRPNGWDHVPAHRKIPCGESSMWGDYHALELGLLIQRMSDGKYVTFYDGL
ncbi:MAG: glycosyl hydrolase [Phycisphaeraceae bacterium]